MFNFKGKLLNYLIDFTEGSINYLSNSTELNKFKLIDKLLTKIITRYWDNFSTKT